MKITKYAQSCFIIESSGIKIIIDPGNCSWDGKKIPKEWKNADAILITHRHEDHCDVNAIRQMVRSFDHPRILAPDEVKKKVEKEVEDANVVAVKQGDSASFGTIEVETVQAVHGYFPGKEGTFNVEAVGYVIDDRMRRVYHCGDTIAFKNSISADIVLVPICGNSVVMEPGIAVEFCKQLKPALVIPMHYDSDLHPKGTKAFEEIIEKKGIKYKILNTGKSIEV